jgi:hypothetical protein
MLKPRQQREKKQDGDEADGRHGIVRTNAELEEDAATPPRSTGAPGVQAADSELTRSQKKNLKRRRKLERQGGCDGSTTTAAAAQAAAQAAAAAGAAAAAAASAEDDGTTTTTTTTNQNAKRLRAARQQPQQQQQQQPRRPPLPQQQQQPAAAGSRRQQHKPPQQQPVPSFAGSVDHGSAASPTRPHQQQQHNWQGASSTPRVTAPAASHPHLPPLPLPPFLPSLHGLRRHGSLRGPDLSGVARLVALELPVAEEEQKQAQAAAREATAEEVEAARAAAAAASSAAAAAAAATTSAACSRAAAANNLAPALAGLALGSVPHQSVGRRRPREPRARG